MEFKILNPNAPSNANSPSNPNPNPMDSHHKHRRNRRFCLIATATLISLLLLLSILGATVFKARRPITTVNSVTLRNADLNFRSGLILTLNISLDLSISVTNPNKVGFRFSDSSAFVEYRGQVVGQVPIPAGKIGAGGTLPMNLTLTLMADRFLTDSQSVLTDLLAGSLPLSTNTRISGKVIVLFFKVHVVSYASCNLNISVASRKIDNTDCTYKTHL